MVVATRIMNLVSGVLILASGVILEIALGDVLPGLAKLVLGLSAAGYFGYRLSTFLRVECTPERCQTSSKQCRNLELDFMRQ